MKRPSIDRINSNGNYSLVNCRFIELSANARQGNLGRKHPHSDITKKKISKTIRERKRNGIQAGEEKS